MAYDKDEILGKCLKAIEEHELCFFDEISLFVQPDLSTLYLWKFNELEEIKNGLNKHKLAAKRKLKRNWQRDDAAPVLQLAVYKLMSNDEEFNKLTTSKSDVKADVNLPQLKQVIITPNGSTEQSDMADAQSV